MPTDQNWTAEPWALKSLQPNESAIVIVALADETLIADWRWTDTKYEETGDWIRPADAHRIVSCVNACANIPDPAAFVAAVEKLTGVCDEIIKGQSDGPDCDPDMDNYAIAGMLTKALAALKDTT